MYHGKRLRPYQERVLWSLYYCMDRFPGETFTVMFPRQAGKNELSAWLVADRLIDRHRLGGNIVLVAPTLHPQGLLSYERTLRHLRAWSALQGVPVRVDGDTIHCGEARVTFLSGSPGANVAGHTASLLLIADEAQDIEEEWFNRQFRPMTASTNAPLVLFGTPWRGDSLLEKAVERNRQRDLAHAGDSAFPWLSWHHEIGWRDIAEELDDYGDHVNRQRKLLGAANPVYLTQYELQVAEDDARLLSNEALVALEGEFPAFEAPVPGARYVAGLDLAGEGAGGDCSVLTLARIDVERCEVGAAWRWQGLPFDTVQEEVERVARRWDVAKLVCDASGLGAPISAALEKRLGRVVERFVFTSSSKSDLGFELLAAAATGRLTIARAETPGLEALWHELRWCRAERRFHDTLSWAAPQGEHDDCVASLALCLRAASAAGQPRVARGRGRPIPVHQAAP